MGWVDGIGVEFRSLKFFCVLYRQLAGWFLVSPFTSLSLDLLIYKNEGRACQVHLTGMIWGPSSVADGEEL